MIWVTRRWRWLVGRGISNKNTRYSTQCLNIITITIIIMSCLYIMVTKEGDRYQILVSVMNLHNRQIRWTHLNSNNNQISITIQETDKIVDKQHHSSNRHNFCMRRYFTYRNSCNSWQKYYSNRVSIHTRVSSMNR